MLFLANSAAARDALLRQQLKYTSSTLVFLSQLATVAIETARGLGQPNIATPRRS